MSVVYLDSLGKIAKDKLSRGDNFLIEAEDHGRFRLQTLTSKKWVLLTLSVSQLLALTLWFSANAVIPQLEALWDLSSFHVSLLSIFVILGFVTGSLVSAIFNIPDVFKTKNVFAASAFLGAMANLIPALYEGTFTGMLLFRFLTGFFLAGVYPTGMKLASTWFKDHRGFAISAIVASLTLGSGLPFLMNLVGLPDWRLMLVFSSFMAFIGGALVYVLIEEGPYSGGPLEFSLSNIKTVIANKGVRLADYGYFGHMWELCAMWAWMPIFLRESYLASNPGSDATLFFSLGTFLVFLTGAISTLMGGLIADRYGKIEFNIATLAISGACSLTIGFFFGRDPLLVLIVALIWGAAVIADSPQYSALVTELSDARYMGTALTLQTAVGFLIAVVSIRLIPLAVDSLGWNYAFTILALGPIFGIASMLKLKGMKTELPQ